jgi:bifunctional non-homologous end joining protein LigD
MRLKEYAAKRNFRKTPEPKPARARGSATDVPRAPVYAIQEHRASHLHYDLRLEADGVLKSWAIPKTPPTGVGEKRLAVETEDHPLGYESFEGVIPEGEYGAGTVRTWDKGTYLPLEAGPGKRIVELRGRKLKGVYALIKLKPKPGEKPGRDNWLFFRMEKRP